MKPQLEDVVMELTSESSLVSIFPFSVHYFEGNVLVWRPSRDSEDAILSIVHWQQFEGWCGGLVNQVRIEDVELVSLHNFGRRIVKVVVGLIVFVPLKPSVNSVEISRLPRSVLVTPLVTLLQSTLNTECSFIITHSLLRLLLQSFLFRCQNIFNLKIFKFKLVYQHHIIMSLQYQPWNP